ncbi:MAG: hypothetical protein RLZZ338_954 [Cyanobacteriota bacterium]|jgi:hypothetical protein
MFYEEIRVGLSYSPKLRLTVAAEVDIYSRRKKEEAITSRVSAIKNVLTSTSTAIPLPFDTKILATSPDKTAVIITYNYAFVKFLSRQKHSLHYLYLVVNPDLNK